MAKKLTDKLNTLIRSRVQGAIDDLNPLRRDRPPKVGKDSDRQIAALRQQINEALDHEDRLTAEIGAMGRQIADWDQQADLALTKGDEAGARQAVREMQLLQKRQAMLEADLAQHRYSTSELISRANELEALVAEARQQSKDPVAGSDSPAEQASPTRLSQSRPETSPPVARQDTPIITDEQMIEDDLARRRARLSQ